MTSDDPAAAVETKRSAAAPAKRSSTRRGGGPAHADGVGQGADHGHDHSPEFIGRGFQAQTGDPASFQGVPVQPAGFVGPALKGEGGWRIVRLKIACCAGDATAMRLFRVADRCVHGPGPEPAFASLPRR